MEWDKPKVLETETRVFDVPSDALNLLALGTTILAPKLQNMSYYLSPQRKKMPSWRTGPLLSTPDTNKDISLFLKGTYRDVLEQLTQKLIRLLLLYIIGGVAVIPYGNPRLTKDIDLVFQERKVALTTLYNHNFRVVAGTEAPTPTGAPVYRVFATKTSAYWSTMGLPAILVYESIVASILME